MRVPPARRAMRGLLVGVLATGVLVVPVTLAQEASAAPCPPLLPVCLAVPAATSPTTVTGIGQVGRAVTATAPVWDQDGVTTTYAWLRDGEPIEGATEATYTLTGDDFDTTIVVRATGTNALQFSGTSDSAPVEPALGEAITASTAPVVTGSSVPGGTLTTTDGTWPGSPEPTYTYQWYRSRPTGSGAQAIAGATTATYSPVVADAGRSIVAVVFAERVGYARGASISSVATVPKTTSATSLTLLDRTVRTSESARLRVTLRSGAALVPTGVVTILDGTRRVRTFRFAVPADGVATFSIARLTRGTHRLTARYAGDGAHRPSTSPVRVLTVTR